MIRRIRPEELCLLSDFLYDAIFIPEGEIPPDKSIINKPELTASDVRATNGLPCQSRKRTLQ